MIDIETRLLEIMDWDEEEVTRLYELAAQFLEACKQKDRESLEKALTMHLRDHVTEEGAKLVFRILDQNIRQQMRIIEE